MAYPGPLHASACMSDTGNLWEICVSELRNLGKSIPPLLLERRCCFSPEPFRVERGRLKAQIRHHILPLYLLGASKRNYKAAHCCIPEQPHLHW